MRCPKCQYLGFDGHTRCRNCGYDLSLSSTADVAPPGPPTPGPPAPVTPVPDLPLRSEPSAREQARAAIRQRASGAAAAPVREAFDLPLFAAPGAEDVPVAPPPPAARPPLAVRRPVGDTPRPWAAEPTNLADEPRLELDLSASEAAEALPPELDVVPEPLPVELDVPEIRAPEREAIEPERPISGLPEPSVPSDDAVREPDGIIGLRVMAGLVDGLVLAAIAALVIVSTLRVVGLPMTAVNRLPIGPLAVFLTLLGVGYLAMCTGLSGQTAGKALCGLQVVEVGGRPVTFGAAIVRAVLQLLTVPLLGLGFLPAALSTDRRALYDRLTNTEVIRTRR